MGRKGRALGGGTDNGRIRIVMRDAEQTNSNEVMVELSHTEEGKIIPINSALRDAIHRQR